MTIALPNCGSLVDFLQLPDIDSSPAWEFIEGVVWTKPMPGGKHSRLRSRLASAINIDRSYEAFPELRCTFGGRSIVPDIAVLASIRIPIDEHGEIISTGIDFAPNWVIEILSPDRSLTRVTCKILHCLRHGCEIGWLIDPIDRVVLAYRGDRLPSEFTGDMLLPCLEEVSLELTVDQMFGWLKVAGNR
ncbi:MAG: Uma2 family endonuclease [Hormoscilla sp. SP12CHS1]|nr:Uma2 family endonuclease [Hormoscilla sp. SP12CHS1]